MYTPQEASAAVEGDDYVLTVSGDGHVRGITSSDRAPLCAVLRVEGDVVEIVRRLDDFADRAEGASTDVAVEVAALRSRVRRLQEEIRR